MPTYTHKELCGLAVKWLKRPASKLGHGCQIAIEEPQTWGECPDAIGYRYTGYDDGTIVIEVKTSRSDFLKDSKKPHRQEGQGMGMWRYFLCPEGMIKVEELPEGWGLLYINNRGHIKAVAGAINCNCNNTTLRHEAMQDDQWRFEERNTFGEMFILVRWINRIGDANEVVDRIRKAENARSRLFNQVERQNTKIVAMGLEIGQLKTELAQLKSI